MTARKNTLLTSRKSTPRSRLTVRGSGRGAQKVPLAKAGKVPPGAYRSTIRSIREVKTSAGDEAVEVVYDLAASDGRQLQMREIIPDDTWVFELFCDALIAAGLKENEDLSHAVGIVEDVELVYPNPKGFGHFKSRIPVATPAEQQTEESPVTPAAAGGGKDFFEDEDAADTEDDEEFDDFLEEDDE